MTQTEGIFPLGAAEDPHWPVLQSSGRGWLGWIYTVLARLWST